MTAPLPASGLTGPHGDSPHGDSPHGDSPHGDSAHGDSAHGDSPHGDDARQVAAAFGLDPDSVLDLSASLNPFAPDVAAMATAHLGTLRRYPDRGDLDRATLALANGLGVVAERVLLTNGGSEAIALVAADIGEGWVDRPEFSLYERHLSGLRPGAPRFRSDPHNPTGRLARPDETAEVWDEAFYPLATGRWTRGDAAQGSSVVVGSLTKLFACPGLRVGYVVAPASEPELIERLAAAQPRWSVNGLALALLPELMAAAELEKWQQLVAEAREELGRVLAAHGLRARASDANYVLVHGSDDLRDRLAGRGVVVRDCSSFGLTGTVRMAVPGPEGLERLDRALRTTRSGGTRMQEKNTMNATTDATTDATEETP
jgi:histidinol-phosphate/aromatic aminotransferase/cobyric acid decarboxylase-like protein